MSGRSIAEVGRCGGFGEGGNLVHRPAILWFHAGTEYSRGVPGTWVGASAGVGRYPVACQPSRELGSAAGVRRRGIGEVDGLQPLLGGAVAAVGVRVVPFGEFLVARLHLVQRHRPGRPSVASGSRSSAGASARRGAAGFAGRRRRARAAGRAASPRRGADAELAERPGRALPGGVGAQLRLDLAGRHAFVEVPGGIVGAHVVEAEPPVVAELQRAISAPGIRPRAPQPGMSQGRPGASGSGA